MVKKIWNRYLPYIILIASIVLTIIGIVNNQPEEVFEKAVLICLECIGVG